MIKVTLEFTTLAAAISAMSALNGTATASAIAVTDTRAASGNGTPPAPSPAPTAAPVPASAPAASTASSPKPSESPAPAASAGTSTGEALTYEKDVKPLVLKVGAAGKRDNLVELLKKFGVGKGPELPADKLPAFKADLEALLA